LHGTCKRSSTVVSPCRCSASWNGWQLQLIAANPFVRCQRLIEYALARRWNGSGAGETHVVVVTADAFLYRGKHHRSLSEIARLITGTRWNGPAFFGLRSGKDKAPAGSGDAN
jgi:hypothetical protein